MKKFKIVDEINKDTIQECINRYRIKGGLGEVIVLDESPTSDGFVRCYSPQHCDVISCDRGTLINLLGFEKLSEVFKLKIDQINKDEFNVKFIEHGKKEDDNEPIFSVKI